MQTNRRIRIIFFMPVLALVLLAMVGSAFAQEEESTEVTVEIIAEDLDGPSDFSVTADGEVVFIAELGANQIRRVQGDTTEVVVSGIESEDQTAESIAVQAINRHQILVGASGFSSAKEALCLFDVSADRLPLSFVDQHLKHKRSFERSLEKKGGINVLRLFSEQRGLSMVCRFGDAPPTVCYIRFKDGKMERLTEHRFEGGTANLEMLAVDQMGGYLVALSQEAPRQLVFYRAERTSMQSFPVELENIVSLSFSPKYNRLFALVNDSDAQNTGNPSGDGIYELLANGDSCESRLVIAIERPEKLKFDAQGNGWVLCRSETDRGFLKKVKNLDVSPVAAPAKREKSK